MTYHRLYADPVHQVAREFDRLAGQVFNGTEARPRTWTPAADILESSDAFTLLVELPGVARDGITLNVENGILAIAGERSAADLGDDLKVLRSERVTGRFSRTFRIGRDVDVERIDATFRDGILTVTLPKAETARARKIDVTVA